MFLRGEVAATGSRLPITVALSLALLASASPAVAQVATNGEARSDTGPTFYADVQPILQQNCAVCHRPAAGSLGGLVAPMSLQTYEEARPWAPMIAEAVKSGRMPPWSADVRHKGTFIGERYLEEEEKATLIAWAALGAPAGDPADAKVAVAPAVGVPGGASWWLGKPDLVVEFPHPVTIPDEVDDWQPNFLVELPKEVHQEPKWIKAMEASTQGHVHHFVSNYLGVYAPGRGAFYYPEGWSALMPPEAVVTFNMHYFKTPGPGTALVDDTKGALKFYEPGEVIDHIVQTEIPTFGRDLVIPAGHRNYPVTFERAFDEDTYLFAMGPHAHYRGKSFEYALVYPDGKREVLLWIPNYDFNWQHMYQYEEPVLMPAGSKLVATWWFDNSEDNPYNPDHTIDVRYGPESYWEMANARIYYANAKPRGIVVGGPIPEDIKAQVMEQDERLRQQLRDGDWMQTNVNSGRLQAVDTDTDD